MPVLPDSQAVSKSVAAWSAAHPPLAGLLAKGLPLDEALSRWGLLLLRQNNPSASAVFQAALAFRPNDPVLWINCGLAFDQAGSPAEAAFCFEKSTALDANQADAWLLLGLARKKEGHPVAAEKAYRQAAELEPESPVAWQCLGLLQEELRDYPAAIESLNKCLEHGGANAPTFANLGKLHYQIGKFPEAHAAYNHAAELDPANLHYRELLRKTRFLCDALRNAAIEEAFANYRKSFAAPEVFAEPELIEFFDKSISLLGGFGHLEAALRLGKKRPAHWPPSPTSEYILQAISGDAGLKRSPARFIVEHFDAAAAGFESHLINDLGYDIPKKLAAMVQRNSTPGRLHDVLDAGCGTGLCGPLFRPMAQKLVGVDLSGKMLDQARKRGVYDELACEELAAFLNRCPAQFDLVVAADVIIYFGDLAPIFAAAAVAMRPGALLAFSTEINGDGGYRLLPSGHFAHAPDYVGKTAGESSFTQESCVETAVRLEANRSIRGNIFLFRRQ
jgi:predicted TPR repeat methyltransferase